jgi:hypothetical protein
MSAPSSPQFVRVMRAAHFQMASDSYVGTLNETSSGAISLPSWDRPRERTVLKSKLVQLLDAQAHPMWTAKAQQVLMGKTPSGGIVLTSDDEAVEVSTASDALNRLDRLRNPANYSLDFDAPAPEVLQSTETLLRAAYAACPSELKLAVPSVTAIGDGGIFLRWKMPGRQAWLTVPPAGLARADIYHRDALGDGVEVPVTSERLAHWLRWLADA